MSSDGLRAVLRYIKHEYGKEPYFQDVVAEMCFKPDLRTIEEIVEMKSTEETTTTTPPADEKFPGPVALRYVLFNDGAGIYLGPGAGTQGFWSGVNPGGVADAPTFANSMEAYDHAKTSGMELREYRLIEVTPDRADNRASVEACANRALPRWNPEG